MQYKVDNEVLTIFLEGKINSANSYKFDQEVDEIISKSSFNQLVFDCEKLSYISSAGIRVILKVEKKIHNTKLTKVCYDVYKLLDLVGFTKVLTAEKVKY